MKQKIASRSADAISAILIFIILFVWFCSPPDSDKSWENDARVVGTIFGLALLPLIIREITSQKWSHMQIRSCILFVTWFMSI